MPGMINNQWDRDNLDYLMSLTRQQFEDWYKRSTKTEHLYAEELFVSMHLEFIMENEFIQLEYLLSNLSEYSEAKSVIERLKNA